MRPSKNPREIHFSTLESLYNFLHQYPFKVFTIGTNHDTVGAYYDSRHDLCMYIYAEHNRQPTTEPLNGYEKTGVWHFNKELTNKLRNT